MFQVAAVIFLAVLDELVGPGFAFVEFFFVFDVVEDHVLGMGFYFAEIYVLSGEIFFGCNVGETRNLVQLHAVRFENQFVQNLLRSRVKSPGWHGVNKIPILRLRPGVHISSLPIRCSESSCSLLLREAPFLMVIGKKFVLSIVNGTSLILSILHCLWFFVVRRLIRCLIALRPHGLMVI